MSRLLGHRLLELRSRRFSLQQPVQDVKHLCLFMNRVLFVSFRLLQRERHLSKVTDRMKRVHVCNSMHLLRLGAHFDNFIKRVKGLQMTGRVLRHAKRCDRHFSMHCLYCSLSWLRYRRHELNQLNWLVFLVERYLNKQLRSRVFRRYRHPDVQTVWFELRRVCQCNPMHDLNWSESSLGRSLC